MQWLPFVVPPLWLGWTLPTSEDAGTRLQKILQIGLRPPGLA
jgi:hypothetical protein